MPVTTRRRQATARAVALSADARRRDLLTGMALGLTATVLYLLATLLTGSL